MAIDGGWDNRLSYLQRHYLGSEQTVHAGLCHGNIIAVVDRHHGGQVIAETDGLITAEPHLALAMTAADCLLVYGYDPASRVIGLVHAGRKGLALNVIGEFLQTWQRHFPMNAGSLRIGIGPHICPRHYLVQAKDAEAFADYPTALRDGPQGIELNLLSVAKAQLVAGGVRLEHIVVDERCTLEDPKLFSYRRDHPSRPMLHLGLIVNRAAA